jgi:hypothetical protein
VTVALPEVALSTRVVVRPNNAKTGSQSNGQFGDELLKTYEEA